MSDFELRVVKRAGVGSHDRLPKWQHVAAITGLPCRESESLCRYYGYNPHTLTGGCPECDSDALVDEDYNYVCECV